MSLRDLPARRDLSRRAETDPTPIPVLRRQQRARAIAVSAILGALLIALGAAALLLGRASLTPAEVLAAAVGQGTPLTGFVIGELRLPRLITAVVVGGCLGMAGAVFQATLRNPLASPDIIGVTASASVVGVVGVLSFGLSGLSLAITVVVGSLFAAALMYLLAWRDGLNVYRLVLVGIGVAAVSGGAVSFVLSRSDIRDAQTALVWVTGSLNGASWAAITPVAISGAVIIAVLASAQRALRALEFGDDTAAGLGVRVERTRLIVIAGAVALAAVAVSVAGPIAFVALASGQIARRLAGRAAAFTISAFVGALLLLAADLIAQFAWPAVPFPTGVVTGLVGAPLLIWLLIRGGRSGTEG